MTGWPKNHQGEEGKTGRVSFSMAGQAPAGGELNEFQKEYINRVIHRNIASFVSSALADGREYRVRMDPEPHWEREPLPWGGALLRAVCHINVVLAHFRDAEVGEWVHSRAEGGPDLAATRWEDGDKVFEWNVHWKRIK